MARRKRPELTEDQRLELRESFELFDADKKGSIDLHELKVLMRALGLQVSAGSKLRTVALFILKVQQVTTVKKPFWMQVKKAEVVKFVHELDPVNEGEVGMDLFMRLMAERYSARDPDEEVMKAFQLFDSEGIGSINIRSLKSIARELGETLTDEELQAMIDEFDKDQDGEINAEEFKYIMTQSSSY